MVSPEAIDAYLAEHPPPEPKEEAVSDVVYENGEEMRKLSVGYFPGQPYVVKIDTPDGVDRQYEGTAKLSV